MTPEARLRTLEDREAIRDLIARYGPLADSGQAAAVARLWCDDGVYAVGGMAEAKGHAAISALIEGHVHQKLMTDGCAHFLGPVAIELTDDSAIVIGYSLVLRQGDKGIEPWRMSSNRWTLRRTPEGWRVARRDNAPLNGGAAARALLSFS